MEIPQQNPEQNQPSQEPIYVRIPRANELRAELLIAKKNTYLMLYETIQKLKNRREVHRRLRKASSIMSEIFSLLKQLKALLPEAPNEIDLQKSEETEEKGEEKVESTTVELNELQKELLELENELKELLETK